MKKLSESFDMMTGTEYLFYVARREAADRAWQAAFDGVLDGVDEELIAAVASACIVDFMGNEWSRELYDGDVVRLHLVP